MIAPPFLRLQLDLIQARAFPSREILILNHSSSPPNMSTEEKKTPAVLPKEAAFGDVILTKVRSTGGMRITQQRLSLLYLNFS